MKCLDQCRIERAQALLRNTQRQLRMKIGLEAA